MKILVITGTPGTGKTTLAKNVAKLLGDCVVIDASRLAEEKHLYKSRDSFGTKIVDLASLKREIKKIIKLYRGAKYLIVEGHLASEIGIKGAIAVVLRSHLKALERRLVARGYPAEKVRDNIVSEAIDYSGASAARNYRHVYELMSGQKGIVQRVISIINGKYPEKKEIELLEELKGIISKNRWHVL